MIRTIVAGLGTVAFALLATLGSAGQARADAHYKIVTGPERGTYIQIGADLAKYVAAPAGIDLEVLASKGSAENVQRMRYEPGVKLALVQSDVYQAFVDMADAGNDEAGTIIRPLRLIMPLYNEEIYFVVRADSPMEYIQDIKGKTISVGLIGSGTAQSGTTLYRLMFGRSIDDANIAHLSNEDSLAQLIAKQIDVAIVVAGQPAKLFTDMNPELLAQIKFLKLDPNAPETARGKQTYFTDVIHQSSYPNWLKEDVPTWTVKAYLVTYDYGMRDTVGNLDRFADSLCTHFDDLQAHGHPKWKEVKLDLPPLSSGWKYYPPVERHLRACLAHRAAVAQRPQPRPVAEEKPKPACSSEEQLLMLCK